MITKDTRDYIFEFYFCWTTFYNQTMCCRTCLYLQLIVNYSFFVCFHSHTYGNMFWIHYNWYKCDLYIFFCREYMYHIYNCTPYFTYTQCEWNHMNTENNQTISLGWYVVLSTLTSKTTTTVTTSCLGRCLQQMAESQRSGEHVIIARQPYDALELAFGATSKELAVIYRTVLNCVVLC